MKRCLFVSFLIVFVAGCRDDAVSMSREIRNVNNEYIDGLMIAVDERSAKMVLDKIVDKYRDRIESVEKRIDRWVQNSEKSVVELGMYSTDGLIVLYGEAALNKKRLDLELARLKKVVESIGDPNAAPSLVALASPGKHDALIKNLTTKGKFNELFMKMQNEWKVSGEKFKNFQDTIKKRYPGSIP